MSLDKAIAHGKEKRKQYRKPKLLDKTCRNHGSCAYCQCNRMFSTEKRIRQQDHSEKQFGIVQPQTDEEAEAE